jgi:hypothetical protein
MFVLRLYALSAPPLDSYNMHHGMFLKEYDPDGNGGAGIIVSSRSLQDAKQYESVQEAIEHYRAVSKTHPRRVDGEPNRPITAFSAEVLSYKDALEAAKAVAP